jgi:hypothetical protein
METDALSTRVALIHGPKMLETMSVARDVLERLVLKHAERQWGNHTFRPVITDTQAQGA